MTSDFQSPPVIDLRQDGLSTASTTILVHVEAGHPADYRGHAWVLAEEIELTERSWSQGHRGCWTLDVRRHGATDFEHDVAVALRIGLTGVSFRMASGGRLWLDGYVSGDDLGMFRVPEPGWDQLEGAVRCTHRGCRAKDVRHLVVSDGRYVPPPNRELFERLRGLRVEIITGINK